MKTTNVTPKNITTAEEDLRVAQLRFANNPTLDKALAVTKASTKLNRLMKSVCPIALAAHRKKQAEMAGESNG